MAGIDSSDHVEAVIRKPSTIEELQALVHEAEQCCTLHRTFGPPSSVKDELILSLKNITPQVMEIDESACTVTCSAGITFAMLAAHLEENGWALHTLPSDVDVAIGDALTVGTHGSGDRCECLLAALVGCEYVDGDGNLISSGPSRSLPSTTDTTLQAILLGGLGIVVEVTLRIERSYLVRQDVYVNMPWGRVEETGYLDELFAHAYSVSMFTDFVFTTQEDEPPVMQQVWFKHRLPMVKPDGTEHEAAKEPPSVLFGATLAPKQIHPIPARKQPGSQCTKQGNPPGPWSERLPHYHPEWSSSEPDGLHSEYYIAREHGVDAIQALRNIAHIDLVPRMNILEIRSVAADEVWCSPAYRRPSLAFDLKWGPQIEERMVRRLLIKVESALAPFLARPGWGTVFNYLPDVIRPLYPMMPRFRELVKQHRTGANRKFRNPVLDRYILEEAKASAQASAPASAPFADPHAELVARLSQTTKLGPRPYDMLLGSHGNGHVGRWQDEVTEEADELRKTRELLTRPLHAYGGQVRYTLNE